VESMYPEFVKDAEAEGVKKALTSFKWAWEVEKVHEQLYRKMLEAWAAKLVSVDYYVCPVCGYTHEGPLEGKCPCVARRVRGTSAVQLALISLAALARISNPLWKRRSKRSVSSFSSPTPLSSRSNTAHQGAAQPLARCAQ